MRSDHLAKHIKTHQNKKGVNSSGAVVASMESAGSSDSIITTAGGTTLILTNIQQGSSVAQDILANAEIPLQLVTTVAAGQVLEWAPLQPSYPLAPAPPHPTGLTNFNELLQSCVLLPASEEKWDIYLVYLIVEVTEG